MRKPFRVNVVWTKKKKHYRVSLIKSDGEERMFVFHASLTDALKSAEYFLSLGCVE